ncbi:MAG: response regulator transcription factor [Ruminococcus sp.]|nr:response regulator transcription factor [Ruminococcus sp.]
MARILILEDEIESRKALEKMIGKISAEITVDAAADLARARLLLSSAVSFDLFFLDVNLKPEELGDISGIRFAEEIRSRRQYEFTPLVMVTSVAGLEMEAYRRLHCYQYVVKPYVQSDVEEVVKKVLFHLHAKNRSFIIVKRNGINYKIFCDEIMFCRAIPRGVCLFLKNEQIEVPYLSIHKLLEKLPKEAFFQCHRTFVVNRNAVKYYDLVNQVIQVEGSSEWIDIGVTFKPEVRRVLHGESQ